MSPEHVLPSLLSTLPYAWCCPECVSYMVATVGWPFDLHFHLFVEMCLFEWKELGNPSLHFAVSWPLEFRTEERRHCQTQSQVTRFRVEWHGERARPQALHHLCCQRQQSYTRSTAAASLVEWPCYDFGHYSYELMTVPFFAFPSNPEGIAHPSSMCLASDGRFWKPSQKHSRTNPSSWPWDETLLGAPPKPFPREPF